MQLIHPNSPESPFYKTNITRPQRIKHLFRDHGRKFSPSNVTQGHNNTQLEWTTRHEIRVKKSSIGLIKLGIGTFEIPISYKTYYFFIDTGSDLTWIQCADCQKPPNECFGNPPEFFPNSDSSTYKQIPCNSHRLCEKDECIGDFCSYHLQYGDGSEGLGFVAFETFTFSTSPRYNDITEHKISNIVFGCNIDFEGQLVGDEGHIGIFGLGWGPRSIISQINTQIYDSFSYCFPHYDQTISGSRGYFQIGSEDRTYEGFSATKLLRYGGEVLYYLRMEGISVAQKRLALSRNIFSKTNDEDGTFIDSGYSFSTVVPEAYEVLENEIDKYIVSLGKYRRVTPGPYDDKFELCYQPTSPPYVVDQLPSVTFHFSDSKIEFPPENVFISIDDPPNAFCLAIERDGGRHNILGAHQQSNIKFVYDRRRKWLFFKAENCQE